MKVSPCAWIIVAMVSRAGVSVAQTACDDAPIHAGNELRRAGRDDEALTLFQRAWESCRSPRARAQMGLAEAALGRWLEAEQHLTEALARNDDEWIVRNHAQLFAVRAQVTEHLGSLELRGGVDGAEVLLDDHVVGTLPLPAPLRVVAGSATVTVRAPGYVTALRTTVVRPGQLVRERVELVREPEAPRPAVVHTVAPTVAPTAAPTVAPVVVARPVVMPVAEPPPPSGTAQRTIGWVTGGGALIALGVAIGALAERERAIQDHNDPASACRVDDVRTRCAESLATADTMQTLAIATFVGAAALAATSTVLFVTAPRSRRAPTSGHAGCGVGPGTVGVSCAVSF